MGGVRDVGWGMIGLGVLVGGRGKWEGGGGGGKHTVRWMNSIWLVSFFAAVCYTVLTWRNFPFELLFTILNRLFCIHMLGNKTIQLVPQGYLPENKTKSVYSSQIYATGAVTIIFCYLFSTLIFIWNIIWIMKYQCYFSAHFLIGLLCM